MGRIVPVIMSGGAGTRLWPLSTPGKPKQFHALAGERTLLQTTVLRTAGEGFGDPVIVCGEAHLELVRAQLAEIGATPAAVVLEPVGRNTAPCAAAAATVVRGIDPDALMLLLPADHHVERPEVFRAAVRGGAEAARAGRLVTFGVVPDGPETGYGYIRRGAALDDGLFEIGAFVEKPDRATAQAYLDDGGYYWNAGVFLMRPDVFAEELERFRPDVAQGARAASDAAVAQGGVVRLDPAAFAACPADSVDYAVMERTRRGAVAPLDAGWSDIGSWAALWEAAARDAEGNAASGGPARFEDARGCLVVGDGRPVGVIGLDDVVVIVGEAGVLVARREDAQAVKRMAEAFAAPKGTAG